MNTIPHTQVANYFEGKVFVDEVNQYSDSRGWVSELWRDDDDRFNVSSPKMCYYSHTNPLVMRGPHEHKEQTDFFIIIRSHMLYMFVLDNVAKYFITDPNKIYRIKVDPTVIHSYINISTSNIALTANFPSSLYKGQDKKSEVDEIRHEPTIVDNTTYIVLGAGGRLGSAIYKRLLNNMGFHKYNVIPIFDRFQQDVNEIESKLDTIQKTIKKNYVIINAIGKTNVQSDSSDFMFSNFILPKTITEWCIKNEIHLIHFSTDYIYQQGQISEYTKSKKAYESWLETLYEQNIQYHPNLQKYIHIIRVANLFSQNPSDNHNAINKLMNVAKTGPINIPRDSSVMLTDVADIAEYLVSSYLPELGPTSKYVNLAGKLYSIEEFFAKFVPEIKPTYNYIENPKTVNNPHLFINRTCYHHLDCDDQIRQKVESVLSNVAL